MSDIFGADDDATPLTPDERAGLRLIHIETRAELNEAEQANIVAGLQWVNARRPANILTIDFAKALHKRMFGEVWTWAGNFSREYNRRIGVDANEIPIALRTLFDDATYWIEHTTFPPDEIAARFHQRLTQIHPFPNGNGRHARFMTDFLLEQMGADAFTWGAHDLRGEGESRAAYIAALHRADDGAFADLMAICRS